MDEFKDSLSEQPMSIDNCIDIDNSSNTLFGETVLCSSDTLNRLPDNIYELWQEYLQGNLPPIAPGEVTNLLEKWFNNEQISELPIIPSSSDNGQQSSIDTKRRRIDSDF